MISKLIGRNMKLYFRDYISVFFSLLAVLIVIMLYILFLSDLQVNAVNEQLQGLIEEDSVSYLINSWILAGLLSITCVTSTLGAFGTMVRDREKRLIMDFKSVPVLGYVYPVAMVVSAIMVGTIISIISFGVYFAYLYIELNVFFSIEQILKCIGLIIFSTAMSGTLMGFLVSFLKTNSAFSSLSLIIGTTIGFLNGLYVPMGSLPQNVQNVIKCLPFGHIASLYRKILMDNALDECFGSFPQELRDSYEQAYGVVICFDGNEIKTSISCIYMVVLLLVALVLMYFNYGRKDKEL